MLLMVSLVHPALKEPTHRIGALLEVPAEAAHATIKMDANTACNLYPGLFTATFFL